MLLPELIISIIHLARKVRALSKAREGKDHLLPEQWAGTQVLLGLCGHHLGILPFLLLSRSINI